jgi:acetyltransferase
VSTLRNGRSTTATIERLLAARSIALVGASDRSPAHRIALRNLTLDRGTRVFGVNPRRDSMLGVPCVPTAAALPEVPDVALMMVPDAALHTAVADALDAGVRGFVVPGLTQGARQRQSADHVVELADRAGAALIGPNCMGIAVPGRSSPWIGSIPDGLRPGPLAVITQSGAIGEAIVGLGPRLGLRAVVSVGYEGTVGIEHLCEHFAGDTGTRAVGLFLETVRAPDATLAAWQRLAEAGKPVVCLKVGRSRAAAEIAYGHNGGMVGEWDAFRQTAREVGAICVEDYAEFVEALAFLEVADPPRGARIGALTTSGGEAALLADHAERAGIPFAPVPDRLRRALEHASGGELSVSNPFDAFVPADLDGTVARALDAMAASGCFDLLLAQIDRTPFIGEFERGMAATLARGLRDACTTHGVPGAAVSIQASEIEPEVAGELRGDGIAVLQNSAAAIRAIGAIARDWQTNVS